ncbi:MAG: cytochrome b/b6 domain-containing protein [Pseudobdellovibrio sp.]
MIIWSKLIRLTHWSIAIALILNLFFLEEGEIYHEYVGYTAAAFVAFRLIYGFISKDVAAFVNFPISIASLTEFIRSKVNFEKKDYAGHNPAASIVYILIWFCVLSLALTGWMMGLDQFFGEEWLQELHEYISWFTQFLIVAHLIGMALDSYSFKRKSWLAMFNGKKP